MIEELSVANAVQLFLERVARSGDAPALRTFPGDRALSWREWEALSRAFALRLVQEGVKPGDRIAIWAGTRPLWPIADLGALMAGAVPVGLYPGSAPSQARTLLEDAGVVLAVADSRERLEIIEGLRPVLPSLRVVLTEAEVDPSGVRGPRGAGNAGDPGDAGDAGDADSPAGADNPAGFDNSAGADLPDRMAGGAAEDAAALPGAEADPEQDALLIYTSGSTGEPRGARISHRYLLASARSIRDALGLVEGDVALSFLPFCHAAERVFGLYTRILCGMEAVLVEDHRRIWEAARATRPTVFGGLPRFYEKIFECLQAHEGNGGDPREKIRDFFGDRLRLATSGGAALPGGVSHYLEKLGLPVFGAYGLTEHLCAAMNRPERHDLESSGPPMPGTELRIAPDGEILLRRCELTFSGYLNRERETTSSFTPDGEWLLTGDLGELDSGGFLRVTGRKKELLALSTGKKVAPLPLEARLTAHPWITQAVIVGEGRKFVSALLVLCRERVEAWARAEELPMQWDALRGHPRVRAKLQEIVADVNRDLSRTESVREFIVLERELTQEGGELTPTLKVRRTIVLEQYREEIDGMYEGPAPDTDGLARAAAAPHAAPPPSQPVRQPPEPPFVRPSAGEDS